MKADQVSLYVSVKGVSYRVGHGSLADVGRGTFAVDRAEVERLTVALAPPAPVDEAEAAE